MKTGRLTTNGVHLHAHEYATVLVLLEHGYDVVLIPQSQTKKQQTPDIEIQGVLWEMKSPVGSGKNNIRHNFQNATRQAENIIIDLRRSGIQEDRAIKELQAYYGISKRVRRMKIVTKEKELLEFSK